MTALDYYERSLDCVHCGLCLSSCPTYRVLGSEADSPRGRLYLMRAYAEDRIEDPASIRLHLDRCLDCRACETACPSGVQYGAILETVRSEMGTKHRDRSLGAMIRRFLLWHVVAQRKRLRAAFDIARIAQLLGLQWLAARLRLIPKGMAKMAPKIPAEKQRMPLDGFHAPVDKPRGRVALFTGCVMEHLFGDVNRATLELLIANGFEVDIPHNQVCCGALLIHNGQADKARKLARQNLIAFQHADVIIHNAAGCGAAMKEYSHLLDSDEGQELAGRCKDITEFLAEKGLTANPATWRTNNGAKIVNTSGQQTKVAYDDPCHLCHGQGVRQPPRELLARVPGIELVPHSDPESCCGSAGIYNLVHSDLAAEIGKKKADSVMASGAEVVVTGNPGCMMQIRAHLRAKGSSVPVVHPVELLLPEASDRS